MSGVRADIRTWRVLLVLGALLLPGCAMGRSNVSIDSNSRAPWMNLEFLPSRKKPDTSTYHRSIAQQKSQSADVATIAPAVATPKKEVRLLNWLTPGSERTPLPLPRTDLELEDSIGLNAGKSTADSTPEWWGF